MGSYKISRGKQSPQGQNEFPLFFKKCCSFIKEDMRVVNHFQEVGSLDWRLNNTFNTPIPKVEHAKYIGDSD